MFAQGQHGSGRAKAVRMSFSGIDERLARERRARLQAERLLAQRSEELYTANRKLAEHANALSHQVIEQRQENQVLVGQSTQAKAALEVATEKADEAERRLWDAVTAVDDGFSIFDRDWRLVTANPAFLAAFDGVVDVAPGASYEAILRIATEEGLVDLQGESPDDWIDRMIARWEMPNIPQVDIKLWNGAFVRLLDKRSPQGDTVSIALDITATLKREADLSIARDEAEAAARAKSAFLANMSHEIRTPMNGVVSMADLLCETDLTEEQRIYADTIRNSGEALLVIINEVLDYSKINAGKLVLHPESFDLTKMVHEIFQLLRPSVQGKDLELRLDYDIFLPDRMIGDPGRIRQILTNLIGNAVKFTQKGHVTVHVVGEPPDYSGDWVPLRVVVQDTGIGIPPAMQAHIFGEFNQVEDQANRRHDGTGLGLAITRELVHLMDGEVWLDSEPGVGSAFGFSIVLEADPDARADPVAPLPSDRNRICVINTGRPLPEAIETHLIRLRAQVSEVQDLDAADLESADSVLITQTGSDGADLFRRLRDSGYQGPVLAIDDRADPGPDGPTPVPASAGLAALRAALMRAFARPEIAGAGSSDRVAPAPADAVPGAKPKPPGKTSLPGAAPAGTGGLRLLAAEDNKTNQLVFRTMLKSLDLDLRLVENGRELVEAYKREQPDILFTDISMPEMDGIEAARTIRAWEVEQGLPKVPIVAMTAHAMAEDRDRILAAGIDEYMTKPLKKIDLHRLIGAFAPSGGAPLV